MADQTMKAVRIKAFGGPETLEMENISVPTPGENEMLVKIGAAGVNPVDYKIREGKYPAVKQDKLPYTLGRDVCGTVADRGSSVARFQEGDAVFAMPGIDRGGYAQYVLVKEGEAARKPRSLDMAAAGGVPLAALTAWQGLFRHGRLQKGQSVLIHGGSGGVGHFAVQFAKAKGARVITTVSTPHVELARRFGADQVIDYTRQRFEDEIDKVDLVFDLIAGETQDRSWEVLREGGALVSTLSQPSPEKAAQYGVRAMRYTVEESGGDLEEIGALIDDGKVRPVIAKIFPLEKASAAQQFLQEEHPAGKVVLVVG